MEREARITKWKRLTEDSEGQIRAILRMRADGKRPSNTEIAQQFGCSRETVRLIHVKMQDERAKAAEEQLANARQALEAANGNTSAQAVQLIQQALADGSALPALYATVTREEAIAHLSFMFRLFAQSPVQHVNKLLNVARELGAMQKWYNAPPVAEGRELNGEGTPEELEVIEGELGRAMGVIKAAREAQVAKRAEWKRRMLAVSVNAEVEEAKSASS